MLLTLEQVSKYHNEKCILKDVSFSIEEKEKFALIGINGTGKSTLFRILANQEPFVGNRIQKKDLKIAYLPQNPVLDASKTILSQVLSVCDAAKEYEAKTILSKLGIKQMDQIIQTLSGGQKKRVALAQVLLETCDLLLLDEPTNHLDAYMIEWLEQYLIRYHKAVIMVTHDRYFMEHITNRILELDQGKLYRYEGNYSTYIEEKEKRMQMLLSQEKKRQRLLKKELEWIRAGVQARGTKSKDRIQRFVELSQVEGVQVNKQMQMVSNVPRLGKKIIEIHDLCKCFSNHCLFEHFSYVVKPHERIGILGNNGCGKSTLLNIISGRLLADHGTIDYGDTVKIGYFAQGSDALDANDRVVDAITKICREFQSGEGTIHVSSLLEQFLFDKNKQYQKISMLSGGEKRRLYLLSVLIQPCNVLILDEPTNDLDIQTLQVLEDFLDDFPGVVLVVSHDRYFLDRICDTMWVFQEDKTIQKMIGGYSAVTLPTLMEKKVEKKNVRWQNREMQLTGKEKKELVMIEEQMPLLEMKIKAVDEQMSDSSLDYIKLQTMSEQRSQLEQELEEMTCRWMELEEKKAMQEELKKK